MGTTYSSWADPLSGLTHVRLEPVLTVTLDESIHLSPIPSRTKKKGKQICCNIFSSGEDDSTLPYVPHVIADLQSPLTPPSFPTYLLVSSLLVLVLYPCLHRGPRTLGRHMSLSVVTSTGPEAIGTIHRRFHGHLLPRQPDAGPCCSLYVSSASSFHSKDSPYLSGNLRQGSKEPIRCSDREGGGVTLAYPLSKTALLGTKGKFSLLFVSPSD